MAIITFGDWPRTHARIRPTDPGEFVKTVRRMAFDAGDDFKEALGETGLEDINWRQYDPRQYDPRVIVKQAFAEDDAEREREAKEREEALLKEKEKAESRALPRGAYAPSTWTPPKILKRKNPAP